MGNKFETLVKNPNATPVIYSGFDGDKREKLRIELEKLFNRLGIDVEMNMPDFILAEMVENFIMMVYNANYATKLETQVDNIEEKLNAVIKLIEQ